MKALVIVLALALSACATVTTPRQGVAACYAGVTAMANTAADMDARGKLPADQKARVKAALIEAVKACDAAKAATAVGDLKTADGALAAASSILVSIESSLEARK